jgi:hypothetical protein
MIRALLTLIILAFSAPVGAESGESDTGKSAVLHMIVDTRVQLAFAQTRASVSGLMMSARRMSDELCVQTPEPIGCQLAYRVLYGSVERLETDLARLDAHALSAKLTLDQNLFFSEKKRIDEACEKFAGELTVLEERYPLLPLGP